MGVGEMAHVGVVNISPDEPAHGAAGDNIRSEMFLRGNARRADDSGKSVGGNADDPLVLVLMV